MSIAVDGFNGASGNITLNVNLVPAAPTAPTNVAASDGTFSDKVQVTWTAPLGATAWLGAQRDWLRRSDSGPQAAAL